MREIKFRAWDNLENRMYSNIESGIYRDPDEIEPFHRILEFASYEVMQYTGLKDKNGKEIYEGDIVEYPDAGMIDHEPYIGIGYVDYDENSMAFYFTERETVEMDDIGISTDVEVIGNIHDNPELLEVEQ